MENKILLVFNLCVLKHEALCLKYSLLAGSCKSPVVQQLRGSMFLCFSCRGHMFQDAI